jgi:hypothetical protein
MNEMLCQANTLDNFGYTRLFAFVVPAALRQATFVKRLLRCNFLLCFFVFFAFPDPGIARAFWSMGCEPSIGENSLSEGAWSIRGLLNEVLPESSLVSQGTLL